MQIYPTIVGLYPTSTYGERNERATAAQKAEDRKRLLEAVQNADLGAAPKEDLPTSQWPTSQRIERRQAQVPASDKYRAPSEGKEPNFA